MNLIQILLSVSESSQAEHAGYHDNPVTLYFKSWRCFTKIRCFFPQLDDSVKYHQATGTQEAGLSVRPWTTRGHRVHLLNKFLPSVRLCIGFCPWTPEWYGSFLSNRRTENGHFIVFNSCWWWAWRAPFRCLDRHAGWEKKKDGEHKETIHRGMSRKCNSTATICFHYVCSSQGHKQIYG